jgi:hypothetical protein
MLRCFSADPSKRPRLEDIASTLQSALETLVRPQAYERTISC